MTKPDAIKRQRNFTAVLAAILALASFVSIYCVPNHPAATLDVWLILVSGITGVAGTLSAGAATIQHIDWLESLRNN